MKNQCNNENNAMQTLQMQYEATKYSFFSVKRFSVRSKSIEIPDNNKTKQYITNNNKNDS